MSNPRPRDNDNNDRPAQRRRTDFSALPTLLLQVWPELVVEAREARARAEARNRTLASMVDEYLDQLNATELQLREARERIQRQAVFQTVLMGIIADAAENLDAPMATAIRDRLYAALRQLDEHAVIDLTADDEDI